VSRIVYLCIDFSLLIKGEYFLLEKKTCFVYYRQYDYIGIITVSTHEYL